MSDFVDKLRADLPLDLIERRKRAAERFPESLTDTMGRQHPNIVRRGIMSGQFDNGSLVKGETK